MQEIMAAQFSGPLSDEGTTLRKKYVDDLEDRRRELMGSKSQTQEIVLRTHAWLDERKKAKEEADKKKKGG